MTPLSAAFYILFSIGGELSQPYCFYQLHMDDDGLITVIDQGPPIFSDGFENKSVNAWSSIPCEPLGDAIKKEKSAEQK